MQVFPTINYDKARPVVHYDETLNRVSAEIAGLEKKVYRLMRFIGGFDAAMQERAALKTDVMDAYLNVLRPPNRPQTFAQIQQQLNARIDEVRDNCLENYRGALSARDMVIIDGRQIVIDPSSQAGLEADHQQRVDEEIARIRQEFPLDPTTNFDDMCQAIEQTYEHHVSKFEKLFERKQQLTAQTYELQEHLEPKLAALRIQKAELLSELKVTNVFVACQLGAIDYLKEEISKRKSIWSSKAQKALVNDPSEVGFAPLHYAAYHNQLETVQLLIEQGANIQSKDKDGYLPLHWAAERGNNQIVRLLLSHYPDSINAKGRFDRTPLHRAIGSGEVDTVHLLIEKGAQLNAQTSQQNNFQTPLHIAVQNGDCDMVEELKQYADLNVLVQDGQGRTAVHYAYQQGLVDIFLLLIDHASWQDMPMSSRADLLESLLNIKPVQNAKQIEDELYLHFPELTLEASTHAS